MPFPMRHELKYFINRAQYEALSRSLRGVLAPDPNGDENNEYHIRSLYFDDVFDSALYDKVNGAPERDKYRIRIYNLSDKVIHMECKGKRGTLTQKRSVAITRALCEQLIAADPDGLERTPSGLLRDVYREMRTKLLRPAVIVDYVREAYTHPAQDVRITFDKQLRSGLFSTDLFDPRLPTVPPFSHGEMILEVKYDEFLPPHLRDLLSSACEGAERSAISKYTLCRRFEGKEF